jgi:superfamily I DNA/RNA helicase
MALKDTLAALGQQLAGVSMQAPDARAKLEALVAVLGKGLKPEQATAVGSAALQTIRSRALDIERVTGKRVLDDNNELVDPTETLKNLKRLADKKYGTKNTEAKRRALMTEFTPELGLAIYRTDFSEVDRVKTLATNKEKTEAEAEKFRQSKEGKRLEAGLAKDQAMRGVGGKLAGVHDTLVDTLGVPGAMGVELVGGHVALAGAKALGGKLLA